MRPWGLGERCFPEQGTPEQQEELLLTHDRTQISKIKVGSGTMQDFPDPQSSGECRPGPGLVTGKIGSISVKGGRADYFLPELHTKENVLGFSFPRGTVVMQSPAFWLPASQCLGE